MNKKIATLIVGVLLISIVSAGLVSYLSNMVTGTVNVEGPVFYLDGSQPIGSSYWGLSINDEGISHDPVQFTGSNNKFFVSDYLGVNSFYKADYKLTLSLKTDGGSAGKVDVQLYTLEGNNPYYTKETICTNNPSINIPALSDLNFHQYTIICNGKELSGMDESDRLILKLSDGLNDINYYIQLNGNSKIEVSAA